METRGGCELLVGLLKWSEGTPPAPKVLAGVDGASLTLEGVVDETGVGGMGVWGLGGWGVAD